MQIDGPDQPLGIAHRLTLDQIALPVDLDPVPRRGVGTSETLRSSRVVSDQSRASPKLATSSGRRKMARTITDAAPSAV